MSGPVILRTLLAADAPLLAKVAKSRITCGVLKQGVKLPAVAITEVSTVEIPRINAQAPTTLVDARVQVTVLANTFVSKNAVLALVRKAVNYQRGQVAGLAVVSIRRLSNGPDFTAPDSEVCMQSIDFSVIYHEPN